MNRTQLTVISLCLFIMLLGAQRFSVSGQTPAEMHALAERTFNEALTIAKENKNNQLALEKFEAARRLYAQLEDKRGEANALMNSGRINHLSNNINAAIRSFQLALELYKELKLDQETADALNYLGNTYFALRDEENVKKGIVAYIEAAQIYVRLNEGKPHGASLMVAVGNWFFNQRDKEQALKYFRQAQAVHEELAEQQITFKPLVAKGFFTIGGLYETLGEAQEKPLAVENYKKAADIYRALIAAFSERDVKSFQIETLRGFGDVLVRLNDLPAARASYKQAASVCSSMSDTFCEGSMHSAIGNTYSASHQPDDIKLAIASYTAAKERFQMVGHKDAEIWALRQIANSYLLLNDWNNYLQSNKGLIEIANSLNPPGREILKAEVYIAVGDAALERSQTDVARENLELARGIGHALNNSKILIDSLVSLINVHTAMGNPATVLKLSDEFPVLVATMPHYHSINGFIHWMRGAAYISLGDKSRGEAEFKTAIGWLQGAKEEDLIDITPTVIGNSYLVSGKKDQERNVTQQIARQLATIKDDGAKTYALFYLAMSAVNNNDYDKALEYGRECLVLNERAQIPLIGVLVPMMVGFINWESDKNVEAITMFEKALVGSEATSAKNLQAYTLAGLMDAYKDEHNPRLAILFGKQAVKLLQQLRSDTKQLDSELQKGFVQNVDEIYRVLTALLLTQKRAGEAQQIINQARDQELFDVGGNREDKPTEIYFTPKEYEYAGLMETQLRKAAKALSELQAVKAKEVTSTGAELDAKSQTYRALYDEYLATVAKVEKAIASDAVEIENPDAVADVTEMQTALCSMSASHRTYGLYTFIDSNNLYVLLNKCRAPIQIFSSPVNADVLNLKLLQFYLLLQAPVYDSRRLGKELYSLIIPEELDRELRNPKVENLLWSLDGNLRYIPVGALSPDGVTYLIERHNNSVFTRAKAKALTAKVSPNWTGYGFFTSEPHVVTIQTDNGDEQLKFKALDKNEKQIFRTESYPKGILPGDVYPDKQFSEDSLFTVLSKSRPLVHISSHFWFVPGSLNQSFLLLGDGNRLTLDKLKDKQNLFKGVELLTLSACETAAQLPNASGREIDAFAELAQRLGAQSVVATLWSVSDVSTTRLMKDFYGTRELKGLTKSEALRQSQLDLLKGRFGVNPKNETVS